MSLATIQEAIEDFREGRMVIIVDDEDRENEGDLACAAEKITPEIINFMAREGGGLLCLPLTEEHCAKPSDLGRPGHIFPLRARTGGVLMRPGQTEASVDLARLAGLIPAGVICEIMNDDGTMARVPELTEFCREP